MTLLEVVKASILAYLRQRVDATAKTVVDFYETQGGTVILYSHSGATREIKRHLFHAGILTMLHLVDLDLTEES